MLNDLMQELAAPLTALFAAAIVALATAAYRSFADFVGVTVEKKHEDALKNALEQAAKWAADRAIRSFKTYDISPDMRRAALSDAVGYVIESVPDALEHFGVDYPRLKGMVEARLAEHLPASAPPPKPAAFDDGE